MQSSLFLTPLKLSMFIQAGWITLVPLLIMLTVRKLRSYEKGTAGMSRTGPLEADPIEDSGAAPSQEQGLLNDAPGEYRGFLQQFRDASQDMADVNEHSLYLKNLKAPATLFFLNGLTDKPSLDQFVMRPLLEWANQTEGENLPTGGDLRTLLMEQVLLVSEMEAVPDVETALTSVLFGSTVLLLEGLPGVLILGSSRGNTRSIEDPISESILRGPRIGFTEALSDNTAMLRRQGKSKHLAMVSFRVGTKVEKTLIVAYFKDIADPELVEEVKRRVQAIEMDEVLETGYVEQWIEDDFLSPFPQVQNTERPDRVIAALLEGRVALLLDGSPFALLVPVTFSMMLQSPEDYYERWLPSSFIRMLRFVATWISLFAPALYIAFISFHPGLFPTKLVLSIVSTRKGVPFTTLIEVLILEVSIEILREAGLRLPKPIGPAMGIVGGLIIGQAAVNAGIVSPILVIIVSATAISSFVAPIYSAGIVMRMLRFPAMFSAALFGLYGLIMFFLLLCIHMTRLRSFGVPYTQMLAPKSYGDWKDFFLRAPLRFMRNRPAVFRSQSRKRK
ncbi:spore germination protein [Gorillibacterium sp. CAU 1737]|uniref:spore germination protein n=1 Tax=Gorillibacterium sp. CAU 1737 TaxID=3140362 RepID=UPI0032605621